MPVRDLLQQLRAQILSVARARGARQVRVFGSVARGEEDSQSDVDFMVSLDPGRTLLDLARLEIDLERMLGRRVDVVTADSLLEPIRSTAIRESISV